MCSAWALPRLERILKLSSSDMFLGSLEILPLKVKLYDSCIEKCLSKTSCETYLLRSWGSSPVLPLVSRWAPVSTEKESTSYVLNDPPILLSLSKIIGLRPVSLARAAAVHRDPIPEPTAIMLALRLMVRSSSVYQDKDSEELSIGLKGFYVNEGAKSFSVMLSSWNGLGGSFGGE